MVANFNKRETLRKTLGRIEMKMLRASFFGSMAAVICAVALLAVSSVVIVTKTHAATPLLSAADSRIVAADPVASAGSKAPGPSGYHLLKKIPLGGEGFWDYITFDPATRRLYISRGTRVVVLEVDSGKTVGEIPNTDGVHGIALVPEFNRGFTSNGRAGTVTIFDLKTLKVIGSAQAGNNPDAIIYDPSSKRVFAMNGRSKNATAIDAATGNVAGTIPVDGKPEFAVADGAGHVYVNIEDKSEEQVIDSQNLKVTATWPLKPCQEPSGLAMDITHRRLFAGCDNKMMAVIDADSGKVVATPEIGEGVDANAFDAELGYAYASNGESGTLTVVHEVSPDQYSVVENVPTQAHARTMALDPKTHQVFLVTADFGPAPAATPDNAHPRPTMVKDSFVVLIFGK
jgi:DNA-binding beta-propeller fold protein YncE